MLPCLISAQKIAYVQNRNIGDSGRLISDIIEITNMQQMEGFLVTMDAEKDFDSLDHKFLKLFLVDRNNFEKSRIVCH